VQASLSDGVGNSGCVGLAGDSSSRYADPDAGGVRPVLMSWKCG
jgi:hypothetical protein